MPTAKQSTWIATVLVILLGAIVVCALLVYPVDAFLKVWAVLGTLVGVVTGAIPGFFFASSAQRRASEAQQGQRTTQDKVETLMGLADPSMVEAARDVRPDLFRAPSTGSGEDRGADGR